MITEAQDLKAACDLMFESIVLKVDELDGQLRQFYESLKKYVRETGGDNYEKYEFKRKEVREMLRLSKTQQHFYLCRLLTLDYLQLAGGHANRGYTYRISCWDDYGGLRQRIRTHLEKQLEKL